MPVPALSTTDAKPSTTNNGASTTDNGASTTDKPFSATDEERISRLLAPFASWRTDAQKNLAYVLKELLEDSSATAEAIAEKMGVSSRTIQRAIMALVKAGIVKRTGSDRTGHWEVIPNEATEP